MARTPSKTPAKKPPAKQPDTKVDPMHPDAYTMAMQIVNAADIKGASAEAIVLLKRELARVAGQKPGQPRA